MSKFQVNPLAAEREGAQPPSCPSEIHTAYGRCRNSRHEIFPFRAFASTLVTPTVADFLSTWTVNGDYLLSLYRRTNYETLDPTYSAPLGACRISLSAPPRGVWYAIRYPQTESWKNLPDENENSDIRCGVADKRFSRAASPTGRKIVTRWGKRLISSLFHTDARPFASPNSRPASSPGT